MQRLWGAFLPLPQHLSIFIAHRCLHPPLANLSLSPRTHAIQAYPVMGVIAFAVVFSLGYGLKVMLMHPDARFSKGSRTTIFRGELRGTPLE